MGFYGLSAWIWGMAAMILLGLVFAGPNCLKELCFYQYNIADKVCTIHGERGGDLYGTCDTFQECFTACRPGIPCGCTRKRIRTQQEGQAAIKEWQEERKSQYSLDCYLHLDDGGTTKKTKCYGTKNIYRLGCIARRRPIQYLNCYNDQTQCDDMDGRKEKYAMSCCCREADCNQDWDSCMRARQREVVSTTTTSNPNATNSSTPKVPSTAAHRGGGFSLVVAVVVVGVALSVALPAF